MEKRQYLLLLPLGLGPIFFAFVALQMLADPHLLNYTEGISLLHASRFLHGESLYPPISVWPFVYNTYPPLYPAIGAAIVGLLGTKLFALRLLTIFAELVLVALAFAYVRQTARSVLTALVTGAVLMAVFSVHKFHVLARLDMLLVACTFGGFAAYRRFEETRRPVWATTAAALLVCALLTKPTAAIPAGIMGAYAAIRFFRHRDTTSRNGLLALILAGVVALLSYGLLAWWTQGEFLRHTIEYQGYSGRLKDPRFWTPRPILRSYWPIVLLSAAALLFARGEVLLRVLTTGSWAWYIASSFKHGADSNYSIEPLVLSTVLTAVWVSGFLNRPLAVFGRDVPGAAVALVFFVFSVGAYRLGTPNQFRWIHSKVTLATLPDRNRLLEHMQGAQRHTLSEEPYFAVRAGRPLVLSDPFQLVILARRGKFDMEPLYAALRDGRIDVVLAGARILGYRPLREVIQDHFDLELTTDPIEQTRWYVFRYRGPVPQRAKPDGSR